MKKACLALALCLPSVLVSADQLKEVSLSPGTEVDLGTSLAIDLKVEGARLCTNCPGQVISLASGGTAPVRCGLQLDWGDGSKETVRLGIDKEPPFQFTHRYNREGEYRVKVSSQAIGRFLSAVNGCEADHEETVWVVDKAGVGPKREAESKDQVANVEAPKRDLLQTSLDHLAGGSNDCMGRRVCKSST